MCSSYCKALILPSSPDISSPRLSLDHLSKRFGTRLAVDDLSLRVGAGEIYGLIGPNGSGKTTTTKMVTGLYRPTTGRILIDGIDLNLDPEGGKRRLGYIPDEPFV
ncbi:MAG: ATP-binding cassette domain-containing protein, partial [Candidatus Methylomirabilia bacterium]